VWDTGLHFLASQTAMCKNEEGLACGPVQKFSAGMFFLVLAQFVHTPHLFFQSANHIAVNHKFTIHSKIMSLHLVDNNKHCLNKG